jgi:hypothetical protein
MNMRLNSAILATLAVGFCVQVAQAETLTDFFKQSTIDGQIRSYYFNRLYGAPNIPNQDAFSLGGMLNVKTAPFLDGFGVGVSFYTANSLGANDLTGAPAYPYVDTTLMGPRYSINALGQAYLQFKQPWVLIRAGDQLINTPWLNQTGGRILPATYQAIYTEVTPVNGLHLYGLREFRWKSRTSSDYFKDNGYYPSTFSGDTMYGGAQASTLSAGSPQSNGTLAFGGSYALMGAKVEAWYYDFYQFANMFYGDANYTLKTGTSFDPFIGGQFLREWGNSLLNGATINGSTGYGVDSTAYGVIMGLNIPNGQISFGYNAILPHNGGVGGGAIVSPYTIAYATDPLYTTSMIRGLVELGPGHAWNVKGMYYLFHRQVRLIAAFARYHTYYSGNSNDTYLDVTYFPPGMVKGLSIRDRMEVSNGAVNPGGRFFVYNRVMLAYRF